MVLYRGTNSDDNFPWCFDHFVISDLGVADIRLSLKLVL